MPYISTTDLDSYLNSVMGMFWCGFNGFNQLNIESNVNLDFHAYYNKGDYGKILQVDFSWSTASILTSIQSNSLLCLLLFYLMNIVYI